MDNLERDDLYTGLTEEMLNPGNSREYSMDKDIMAHYLRFQDAVEKGWSEWQKLDTLKREDITEYCGDYEIATTKPFLKAQRNNHYSLYRQVIGRSKRSEKPVERIHNT